jgi:hypothetical protein
MIDIPVEAMETVSMTRPELVKFLASTSARRLAAGMGVGQLGLFVYSTISGARDLNALKAYRDAMKGRLSSMTSKDAGYKSVKSVVSQADQQLKDLKVTFGVSTLGGAASAIGAGLAGASAAGLGVGAVAAAAAGPLMLAGGVLTGAVMMTELKKFAQAQQDSYWDQKERENAMSDNPQLSGLTPTDNEVWAMKDFQWNFIPLLQSNPISARLGDKLARMSPSKLEQFLNGDYGGGFWRKIYPVLDLIAKQPKSFGFESVEDAQQKLLDATPAQITELQEEPDGYHLRTVETMNESLTMGVMARYLHGALISYNVLDLKTRVLPRLKSTPGFESAAKSIEALSDENLRTYVEGGGGPEFWDKRMMVTEEVSDLKNRVLPRMKSTPGFELAAKSIESMSAEDLQTFVEGGSGPEYWDKKIAEVTERVRKQKEIHMAALKPQHRDKQTISDLHHQISSGDGDPFKPKQSDTGGKTMPGRVHPIDWAKDPEITIGGSGDSSSFDKRPVINTGSHSAHTALKPGTHRFGLPGQGNKNGDKGRADDDSSFITNHGASPGDETGLRQKKNPPVHAGEETIQKITEQGKPGAGLVNTHGTGGQALGGYHMDHSHNAPSVTNDYPVYNAQPGDSHQIQQGGPHSSITMKDLKTYYALGRTVLNQEPLAIAARLNYMHSLGERIAFT